MNLRDWPNRLKHERLLLRVRKVIRSTMDIKRALRSIFRSRWHIAALARVGVIACIPIIGQLVLAAYALHYIRAAALNDDSKPRDIRMDVQTLLIGFKCQLLTILGTVAAGLLTL